MAMYVKVKIKTCYKLKLNLNLNSNSMKLKGNQMQLCIIDNQVGFNFQARKIGIQMHLHVEILVTNCSSMDIHMHRILNNN
jgi:hypothetical protein